jgi:hypothetical protein
MVILKEEELSGQEIDYAQIEIEVKDFLIQILYY